MSGSQLFGLLSGFFGTYGYAVVFVGAFLENTLFAGLLVPGEIIVLLGAFFASQHRYNLNVFIVGLLAFSGAFIASNIGYVLGRRGGRPFIERYGEKLFIRKERIDAAERYFDAHGAKTVFISRFAAGIKNFVPALAGASHMNYGVFCGYLTLSLLVWTVAMCALGYFFGSKWPLIYQLIKGFGWVILGVVVLVTAAIVYRKMRARRH